ncbi:hypothetical protein ACHAXT_003953 [Thalassiosira profunda]
MPTKTPTSPARPALGDRTNSSKPTDELAVRSPKSASPPRSDRGILGRDSSLLADDGSAPPAVDGQPLLQDGVDRSFPPFPPPNGQAAVAGGGAERQEAAAAARAAPPPGGLMDPLIDGGMARWRRIWRMSRPRRPQRTFFSTGEARGVKGMAPSCLRRRRGAPKERAQSRLPGEGRRGRRGSFLGVALARANRTDFENNKSIIQNWPLYSKAKYGQLRPPKAYLAQHGSNVAKAHATVAWRKLTHNQQKGLAAHYNAIWNQQKAAAEAEAKRSREAARAAKKAEADRKKAAKKEAKKNATAAALKKRRDEQSEKRKQKRAEDRNEKMTSALLDGPAAAEGSASQAQMNANKKRKTRGRYSQPTTAAQLSDRSAVGAEQQLEKQMYKTADAVEKLQQQFFKSGASITPPPGIEGWATKAFMLTANMDSSNTAPVKVKMLTSHGGHAQRSDIFKLMMETGAFDGEIRDYALKNNLLAPSAETANGVEAEAAAVAPARRVSLELVDSAEEMAAIHAKRKSEREVAEAAQHGPSGRRRRG